jgi:hypothetical protein
VDQTQPAFTPFVVSSSAAVTIESQLPVQELAMDPTFVQNTEYAIAVGIGVSQNSVDVTQITKGRRLVEDSNASLARRRLVPSVLNIQYDLYLSNEDQVIEVRSKLLAPSSRDSFAQTVVMELTEKERMQNRGTVVSGIYISTSVEVEERTTTTTTSDVTSTMIMQDDTTTAADTTTTIETTTPLQQQMALTGGACTSPRFCWLRYAVFAVAFVISTSSLS